VFLFSIIPYILGFFLIATYPSYIDKSSTKEKLPQIKDFFSLFFLNVKKKEVQKAILNATSFDSLFSITKDYIQPILKMLALSLPFFIGITEDIHREALVLGIVYFIIYLLSSFASKNAKVVKEKFRNIGSVLNISYLIGVALIFLSGLFVVLNFSWISILIFLFIFCFHNLRRPFNIAFLSDYLDAELMASGLSAESQTKSLLIFLISPIMGFLADKFGVGYAILIIAGFYMLIYLIVKINFGEKNEN